MSLSIYDIRDMDVMVKLSELGEAGGVKTPEVAASFGLDGAKGNQAVGTRLAWMRRFGITSFDPKKKLWSLTKGGTRVLAAKRRAALKQIVDEMPDGELIEAMAYITARFRLGDPVTANMLRREFIYGTSPRSAVWRGIRM